MGETRRYTVPSMHCGQCERAVKEELILVGNVTTVDVDLDAKVVTIEGEALDDAALRAAFAEAGFEAL